MTEDPRIATRHGCYCIRAYRTTDGPAVLAAWQAAFGKPLSPALWQWKYHAAPHGHRILVCVHEGGDIAALYGGLPYPALWQGREVRIAQPMDVFSHPLHRGAVGGRGGLYVRTACEFFRRYGGSDGLLLLYGLPGQRAARLGERQLGYCALPGGIAYLSAATSRLRQGAGGLLRGRLDPVGERGLAGLAGLSDRLARPGRLLARRDAALCRWRFFDHPERRYLVWSYRSFIGRRWRGYAVALLEGGSAVLADLLLPPSRSQAADMLARIADALQCLGVERIRTWLPGGSPEAAALAAIGFAAGPDPLGIVPTVRLFAPAFDRQRVAGQLYYTMADSDLY